jgi:hypothetical protein
MADDWEVEAVNRRRAIAVTRDGTRAPIIKWFGADGYECEPDEAVVCVAEYGDKFITVDLRKFYKFAGN